MKRFLIIMLMLAATSVYATNATWIGTSSTNWSDTANWTTNPVPGETTNDIATFSNDGNGNTNIYTAAIALQSLTWNTATCAAYTVTGGPITFNWINTADLYMQSTVTNDQVINVNTVRLGVTASAGNYYFRNDSASGAKLIVNSPITGNTGGTAGGKVLNMQGAGEIYLGGQMTKGGAATLTLTLPTSTGTCYITYTGTNYLSAVNMNSAGKKLDLGTSMLSVSNAGAQVIGGGSSSTITNGTIRISSDAGGGNYADVGTTAGNTLTIYSLITGYGIDFYAGSLGTCVLRGTNTYSGATELERQNLNVIAINDAGLPGNLGTNRIIRIGAVGQAYLCGLIYAGAGETNNRTYEIQGGANDVATINHSGTGTFKLTGNFPCVQTGNKTLLLTSSVGSTSTGEIAGVISDISRLGRITVTKTNSCTWVLSGHNAFGGALNVNAGTLAVEGNGTVEGATNVVVLAGATLSVLTRGNIIGDNTPVRISGVMNLATGVVENVGPLYLAGALQTPGTYGSTLSPAANKNDTYFSGYGILNYSGSTATRVSIPAETNVLWQANQL